MRGSYWLGAIVFLGATSPAFGQARKPDVIAKLEGHRGGVAAIAFTLKGDRIATGAGNGTVRLWDSKSGELAFRLDETKHSSARVAHVAFSADGRYLCASSRNSVGLWDLADPKRVVQRYEDPYGPDPGKLGTISGDGRLCYFTSISNAITELRTYAIANRTTGSVDIPSKHKPVALAPISDAESALVAIYCSTGEKNESAGVALVGLGETKLLAKDVPPPIGKPISIGFSPDAKWLVCGNGSKVVYWRVPGSQVITTDPKVLTGMDFAVATAGPFNTLAVATVPEPGRKCSVVIFDIGGPSPKILFEYASGLDRVSALTFSPNGAFLAVGDDAEGVVQLWAVDLKRKD